MDTGRRSLPDEQLLPEVIASLIRMMGGNFRLLTRLVTQIERVLSVNDRHLVSTAVSKRRGTASSSAPDDVDYAK
jgi:hypothetical protein